MGVVLMILGFIWWWPIGLLILGYLIFRRRSPYMAGAPVGELGYCQSHWDRKMGRMQEKMDRMRMKMERFGGFGSGFGSSGNSAFDDYRAETLRRLEDEQKEFKDFLGRLRFAKDRAEFDQFMSERRAHASEPPPPAEPHA